MKSLFGLETPCCAWRDCKAIGTEVTYGEEENNIWFRNDILDNLDLE